MLMSIAVISENGKPMLESRLETVFDLMDFDNSAQITYDEFVSANIITNTILILICI
jgi:Ca2+-binding EF-hand superfamily protein